jgi:hypothetical protein
MLLYSPIQEPFETRLLKLHRDAAELVSELSIDTVLERIPTIAMERTMPVMQPSAPWTSMASWISFTPPASRRAQWSKFLICQLGED